jgi:hypothetical protein
MLRRLIHAVFSTREDDSRELLQERLLAMHEQATLLDRRHRRDIRWELEAQDRGHRLWRLS